MPWPPHLKTAHGNAYLVCVARVGVCKDVKMKVGNTWKVQKCLRNSSHNSECCTKMEQEEERVGIPQALCLPCCYSMEKLRSECCALGFYAFLTLIPSTWQLLTWYILPCARGRFTQLNMGLLPAPMLGTDILVTWSSLLLCESPHLEPQRSTGGHVYTRCVGRLS